MTTVDFLACPNCGCPITDGEPCNLTCRRAWLEKNQLANSFQTCTANNTVENQLTLLRWFTKSFADRTGHCPQEPGGGRCGQIVEERSHNGTSHRLSRGRVEGRRREAHGAV